MFNEVIKLAADYKATSDDFVDNVMDLLAEDDLGRPAAGKNAN